MKNLEILGNLFHENELKMCWAKPLWNYLVFIQLSWMIENDLERVSFSI